MPIFFRSKILLAKIETTYGTDAVPTGAANAILMQGGEIMPMEGEDISRDLDLPNLGNEPSIPTNLHMKLKFRVELAPSGTAGTVPAWGVLLRGCGCAQTISAGVSVTYNPISSAFESLTFYFQLGGTLYRMMGARGNAKFTISAQGIPYIEFEFTGLFTVAAEAARPTPVLTAFQAPVIASKANSPTFTVNSIALVLRSFALDLGNQVENRFLIGSPAGAESVLIVDRAESVEMQVEAEALSVINPYQLAVAQTQVPVVLQHGAVAGRRATINVPLLQVQRTQGLQNQQNIVEWPLRGLPIANAGNDQWTLVLT